MCRFQVFICIAHAQDCCYDSIFNGFVCSAFCLLMRMCRIIVAIGHDINLVMISKSNQSEAEIRCHTLCVLIQILYSCRVDQFSWGQVGSTLIWTKLFSYFAPSDVIKAKHDFKRGHLILFLYWTRMPLRNDNVIIFTKDNYYNNI